MNSTKKIDDEKRDKRIKEKEEKPNRISSPLAAAKYALSKTKYAKLERMRLRRKQQEKFLKNRKIRRTK